MLRPTRQAGYQLSRVSYNAATQAFEALVTLHTSDGRVTYACDYPAPLDTEFEEATNGLIRDARARSLRGADLSSQVQPTLPGLIETLMGRRSVGRPQSRPHDRPRAA